MLYPNKSITLLELLIAIALLSVIVLALSGVDFFSRSHVIDSDRRATLQNEVSRVLEHMSKEIVRAIGNRVVAGQDPIDLADVSGDTAIKIYIDSDATGGSGDGQWGTGGDHWIAYRYTGAAANLNDRYQIWYYDNYVIPASPHEVIAHNIFSFNPSVIDNCVEVSVSACWNPAAANCGTVNNPSITMHTHINMPSVSTN